MADPTSKTCSKCGEAKPAASFARDRQKSDGLTSRCRACRSEDSAKYLAKPGASEAARRRSRKHYLANREAKIAQAAARRAANPEAFREYKRQFRLRNPDESRLYYEANKGASFERVRRRRAMKAGVTVGPIDYEALWTGKCGICGFLLDRDLPYPDDMSKSLDHIVPLALGGTHEQSNLQWAHLVCNKRKGAKAP